MEFKQVLFDKMKKKADEYFGHFQKQLSWSGDEIAGGLGGWYGIIEENYKEPQITSKIELENVYKVWVGNLSNILKDVKNPVFISGALGLSLITEDYSRPHSNTDLSMISDSSTLSSLVSSFKKQDFFLVWRISGALNDYENNIYKKYHLLRPTSIEEAIKSRGLLSRNLEFAKVDRKENVFINKFTPMTHIRVFQHYREGDFFICKEDKKRIRYTQEQFTGIQKMINDNYVYVINPEYWRLKLLQVVKKESKNPKHEYDLNLLTQHLSKKSHKETHSIN